MPQEPILSYATAVQEIRNVWLLWVARVAGGLPLVVGVGTLLAYLVHPMPDLMLLGLWTILIGTGMVAIGFVCVLVYFFTNRMKDRTLRSRVNRQTGWAIALMVADFPAAYLCILIAIKVREIA